MLSQLRAVAGTDPRIGHAAERAEFAGGGAFAQARGDAPPDRRRWASSDKVRNFVFVVIDHRRAHDFASIVDGFETLLDERLGFVAAEVRSATPLTEAQRATLEVQVSRLAGKKAKLKFSSDPALIGGVVAHVGSTVYDGSVRGQLEKLRTRLGAS